MKTQRTNPIDDVNMILYERQLDLERTLLGMVIKGKEPKKGHIMEHICRDMFVCKSNLEIFDMIQDQYKKHGVGRLNADALINDYKAKQFNVAVFEALIDLEYEFITDVNCDFYIQRLQENWQNRIAESCGSIEEFKKLEEEKKKYELITSKTVSSLNDFNDLYDMGEEFEKRKTSDAIKTGYQSIDERIGKLMGGDLMIIGAATGMGKTCMMLNIAVSMAKQGKKVLIFSLEMNKEQLINRIVAAETGLSSSQIRNMELTKSDEQKYWEYIYSEEFLKLDIQICTEYNITTSRMRSIVLGSKADIVFVDYLGLINSKIKQSSYESVSDNSRELKLMAMESDKPFIVLHQLNRANAERKDKIPMLSDLRDSGKIEQDADVIAFVFRPAYYDESADKTLIQLIIAKNRHGESGGRPCNLKFLPISQKITERW